MFEPLHCMNIGLGGDATQHILWRLHNGEIDQIKPKVCVNQSNDLWDQDF